MSRERGQKRQGKSFGKRDHKRFTKGNAPAKKSLPKQKSNPDEIRLNKYIANSGICSRREADQQITAGSNTVRISDPGQ